MNAVRHGGSRVVIGGAVAGDTVQLTIADHGPGLPADDPAGLFEAFATGTGSDRRNGSGLGLAIVRGSAAAMRIDVTAAGKADGAIFTLTWRDGIEALRRS